MCDTPNETNEEQPEIESTVEVETIVNDTILPEPPSEAEEAEIEYIKSISGI